MRRRNRENALVLSDIGYGALLLTLAAAVWAVVTSAIGGWQRRPGLVASARNALLVTAGLSTFSAVLLLILLFTHGFEVRYVYEHVSTYLKPAYILAAFWAGLEGSQLLWLWLLAIFTGMLVWRRPTWDRELRPYESLVESTESGVNKASRAVANQVRTIARERITRHLGSINDEELEALDRALRIQLGL